MELEKQIFADCYNFLRQNLPVRQEPEYWAEIVRQSTEIEQKYPGNKFAASMLKVCTDRICEIHDQKGERTDG